LPDFCHRNRWRRSQTMDYIDDSSIDHLLAMRNRLSLLIYICAVFSSVAVAHDQPMSASCIAPNAGPVVLSSRTFTWTQLNQYAMAATADQDVDDGRPCPIPFTCGGVDRDHYHFASQMARQHCAALTPAASPSDKALPHITSPSIFNDDGDTDGDSIKNHHNYRFQYGLSVSCFVCVSGQVGSGGPSGN
jgi:hypothetical protein